MQRNDIFEEGVVGKGSMCTDTGITYGSKFDSCLYILYISYKIKWGSVGPILRSKGFSELCVFVTSTV